MNQMDFKIVKEYKCAVCQTNEGLFLCRLLKTGELQMHKSGPNWIKVKPPISQHFLDKVNSVLGTNYSEEFFRLERLATSISRGPHSRAKIIEE